MSEISSQPIDLAVNLWKKRGEYSLVESEVGIGSPPYYAVRFGASDSAIAVVKAERSEDLLDLVDALQLLRRREITSQEARQLFQ